MPRGGHRPGSGRPKGPQTLEKEALRDLVRQRVAKRLGKLVDAQIANAEGLKYLVARNSKTGKFERVSPAMLESASDDLQERIEVWEKDPSVQAFTDLLNRTIDKPAEQPHEVKLTGEVTLVSRLQAARKRHADAKRAHS